MKSPKIKAGTVVLRWNDMSYEKGVVFKILTIKKKKYVEIKFSDGLIRIRKEAIKWQKRYLYDKKKWTILSWVAPAKITMEVPVEKTEADWIKTYRAGELVSMKLTEEAYKKMGQKI